MIRTTVTLVFLLTCLMIALPANASDCKIKNRPIIGALKARVGVFDANGKFAREVDSKTVDAGAVVLDCNEQLGLVLVKIAGRAEWVDRLDLNIRAAEAAPCLTAPARQRPDHTEPVSSGIGEHCEPAPGS